MNSKGIFLHHGDLLHPDHDVEHAHCDHDYLEITPNYLKTTCKTSSTLQERIYMVIGVMKSASKDSGYVTKLRIMGDYIAGA